MCGTSAAKEDPTSVIVPPIVCNADYHVVGVTVLPGYRLAVKFLDGVEGTVNMARRVASPSAGVFAALREDAVFAQAEIVLGAVTWPGEIDLAPDAMHDAIRHHGEWLLPA